MHEKQEKPLVACEMELMGLTHADISAEALNFWNLPEPIQNAVRYHHSPEKDPAGGMSLSRVLDAANQYVNSMGVSILKKCPDTCDATLVESLGVPADRLEQILVDFKAEYDAMSAFFR